MPHFWAVLGALSFLGFMGGVSALDGCLFLFGVGDSLRFSRNPKGRKPFLSCVCVLVCFVCLCLCLFVYVCFCLFIVTD